ncbi:MAG: VPA1262 family N-terminal domain-containing protein [Gaiellaceae bacterium]
MRLVATDGAVITDVVRTWSAGDPPSFVIDAGQAVHRIDVRAWVGGELVLEEQSVANYEIRMQILMGGGRATNLSDRLQKQVEGAVGAGQASAETLAAVGRVVERGLAMDRLLAAEPEPWRTARLLASSALFDLVRAKPAAHEYFPVGADGRGRAIVAFAEKIREADRAWLLDPFFDVVGAEALLSRIGNVDAELTIVTNLHEDDGKECNALLGYLENMRGLGLPNITVLRATRSGGDQAFHDRILVLNSGDQAPRAFALTNSFSGLARRYPVIVVELPPGTTAAVLDDLDTLLGRSGSGSVQIAKLWPPEVARPPAPEPTSMPDWRWIVKRLVPTRRGKAMRLRRAVAAGYFAADGTAPPVWIARDTGHAERVLACLLPLPDKPRGVRRKPKRHSMGRAIVALGDMAARGLPVTPEAVVARLPARAARKLEGFLRKRFAFPADPTIPYPGLNQNVMQLRQALTRTAASFEIVRYAGGIWSTGHLDLHGGGRRGRSFAYAVLCLLAPRRALRLAEDLLDPDLLEATVDHLAARVQPWTTSLSAAFLGARSALLRALAAHAVAGYEWCGAVAPKRDLSAALDELRRVLPSREIAILVAAWADPVRRPDLGIMAPLMLHALSRLDDVDLEFLAMNLLRMSRPDFVVALFHVGLAAQHRDARVLGALVAAYGKRLALPTEAKAPELQVNEPNEFPLTTAAARATAAIAGCRGVTVASVVDDLCGRARLRTGVEPLTPFHDRPEFGFCLQALAWSVLWELLAASEGPGSAAAPPEREAAVASARDYIAMVDARDRRYLVKEISAGVPPPLDAVAPRAIASSGTPSALAPRQSTSPCRTSLRRCVCQR